MPNFGKATVAEIAKAKTAEIFAIKPRATTTKVAKADAEIDANWNAIKVAPKAVKTPAKKVDFLAHLVAKADAEIIELAATNPPAKAAYTAPLMNGDYFAVSTSDRTYFVDVISRNNGSIKAVIVDGYGRTRGENDAGMVIEFDKSEIVSAVPLTKKPGFGVLQYV